MKTSDEQQTGTNYIVVAFDVDDTLLIPSVVTGGDTDFPNHKNLNILRWFANNGHYVVVWSGGGVKYANDWVDRLGIRSYVREVIPKEKNPNVDLCFDDCDVKLARVNVKVKRYKNGVSRKEWNNHE